MNERSLSLAVTCNGPGETAGWLRPFLGRLYERMPLVNVHVFFVPDDYATGAEADVTRTWFPKAHVHPPKVFLRAAFGKSLGGVPATFDGVLYLGGDLMHAARLAKRFHATALTYKFSKPAYRELFARAFAVDARNIEQLVEWRTPRERIVLTGNLAIDGALAEARQEPEAGTPHDGILIMPGSRRHEVEHLTPFFFTAALKMARERPEVPVAFGISPFTSLDAVAAAVKAGGDERVYAQRGALTVEDGAPYLSGALGQRFPIVRSALSSAAAARLVVTIPGTKTIEVAALGKPMIACVPMNAPELIPINGPLTYLDRIPLIGKPLKRAAVTAVSARFAFTTQPNIDADAPVIEELRGTLTPGRVARAALDRYDDTAWLERTGAQLSSMYGDHAGAADRMAAAVVECLS